MLKKRRNLKEAAAGKNEDEMELIKLELALVSRRCRKLMQSAGKKRNEEIIEEMWQQHRKGDMYNVHRLRTKLAGNGRGPKKRFYFAPRASLSIEEWKEGMKAPPAQGGMACKEVDFDKMIDTLVPERRIEEVSAKEVTEDLKAIKRYWAKAPKRRACPPWGAPAELWLALAAPNWRIEKKGQGLGFENEEVEAPLFAGALRTLIKLTRVAGRPPLYCLRSQSFASDKGTGKMGVKGARVMHAFDSFGMAFFGGLMKRRELPKAEPFAHGGYPGRSTDGAILTIAAAAWRCHDLKISHTISNYDGTNAFGSTEQPLIEEHNLKYFGEEEGMIMNSAVKKLSLTSRRTTAK